MLYREGFIEMNSFVGLPYNQKMLDADDVKYFNAPKNESAIYYWDGSKWVDVRYLDHFPNRN